ncbi:MAG: hypothetical protein PHH47_11570 [Gallionella sp.]|nr:hypothetical protein [Gallionella sp.]MDD4947390.1 hypothetical protein [Gallionella sp.]
MLAHHLRPRGWGHYDEGDRGGIQHSDDEDERTAHRASKDGKPHRWQGDRAVCEEGLLPML